MCDHQKEIFHLQTRYSSKNGVLGIMDYFSCKGNTKSVYSGFKYNFPNVLYSATIILNFIAYQ